MMTGRRTRAYDHQAGRHFLWPLRRDVAPAQGGRLALFAGLLGLGFLAVAIQLVRLGMTNLPVDPHGGGLNRRAPFRGPMWSTGAAGFSASDINVYGVFADPAQLINSDDAAESVASVLKGVDVNALRSRLASAHRKATGSDKAKHGFVWLARGLTPRGGGHAFAGASRFQHSAGAGPGVPRGLRRLPYPGADQR